MKNKGFTLLELIVVTSLVGIFIGLLSSNFYTGKEQKSLTSAFNHLRSFIDLTRHQSLSSLVPPECPPDSFVGYGLRFDTSPASSKVTRFSHCITSLTPVFDQDIDSESLLFSEYEHITLLSVVPSVTSVYFERATGEVVNHATKAKTSVILTLKNTVLNQCASITINQFGVINENKNFTCL